MEVLKAHGNSIQNLITTHPTSFLNPGSEFRPEELLERLFMHHHNWLLIQKSLTRGSVWPLREIPNEERIKKNIEFIARGNHKSALKYQEEFIKIIKAEIERGWMFPLPLHYVNTLTHGELAPVGIDDKVWADFPDGSKKIKHRLTHDQSFEASVGTSVNGRVIKEKLAPLIYGGCLSRLLHYIVDLRLRHPTVKILGAKSDFKAAYRRVSLHGDIAEKCAIMCNEFALPSVRLTFGGSPCPPEFCIYSEMCVDLANDLLHCPEWIPIEIASPHASTLPEPKLLDPSLHFKSARPLDVVLDPDDFGKADIFIDDGMVIVPDINDNRHRAVQALLLAIHTLCRPLDINEPIKREDCLSLGKLAEEGQLAECFTLLGWEINTRNLSIALPKKKFKRWDSDLGNILVRKKVSYALLESTVGRLNHAATACPIMRYFLSRIRLILSDWDISGKTKRVERYLSSQVLEDIKLWRESFLPVISRGLSLNLITYRRPSFLCWSDACPEGMGGFDHLGVAWRFKIPDTYRDAVQNRNNCLEFLASIITIWQAILQGRTTPEECFLSLGDNSSSVGWLHKASVDPSKNLPLFLASRKFAQIMLSSNSCIYSQHIPGVSNNIADALSRRFDLHDEELTQLINCSPNTQVQCSYKIYPVHPEIDSWMTYWLQRCKEIKVLQKTQKIKRIECGEDGWIIPNQLDSHMTYGWNHCNRNSELTCLEPLPQQSAEENFLDRTRSAWLHQQSKRPWQNWVRSLGQTWGTTPHMEQDPSLSIPYLPGSSKACEI
jgi:hypothetical protein